MAWIMANWCNTKWTVSSVSNWEELIELNTWNTHTDTQQSYANLNYMTCIESQNQATVLLSINIFTKY